MPSNVPLASTLDDKYQLRKPLYEQFLRILHAHYQQYRPDIKQKPGEIKEEANGQEVDLTLEEAKVKIKVMEREEEDVRYNCIIYRVKTRSKHNL